MNFNDGVTVISGRSDELRAAARMLDGVGDGPCALFVEGEPGIGKTTLFDATVTEARERGFRVLRCRPSQSEVRLSHAGLIELLDGVDEGAVDALPVPQRRAMRVALRWDEPGDIPAEQQTICAALATMLRAKAGFGPLLVAIDDLHWLDDSSAQALEYAVRRLEGLPVAVLAAARSTEGNRPRPTERAISPVRVERMILGPLPEIDMGQMLADRFEGRITGRLAHRVAGLARGNPFTALEICRGIEAHGAPTEGEALPVPSDIQDVIARRLGDLSAATRAALLEAASTAKPTSSPLDPLSLVSAEQAGIVRVAPDGEVDFVHPLYQSAVYSAASLAERRAVHARLAERSTEIEERARHLALSVDGPNADAADALNLAAEAAESRGALDVAANLLERSWKTTPPDRPEAVVDRALLAAERFLRCGVLPEVDRIVNAVLPGLTGHLRGRALRLLGENHIWGATLPEAIPIFEEALLCFEDDPASAAPIHLGLSFTYFQAGLDPGAVMQHASLGLAKAESVGPGGPLAEALAVRATVGWLFGEGVDHDAIRRSVELDDGRRFVPVHLRPGPLRATLIGYTGEVAEAIEYLEREIDRSRLLGAMGDIPFLGLHLATMASWHGDLALTRRTGVEVARIMEEFGGGFAQVSGHLIQVTLFACDGDVEAARAAGIEAIGIAMEKGVGYSVAWIAGALGKMELSLGDHEAALRWLEPGLANIMVEQLPDPAALFYFPDAIEALIARGDLVRARSLLDPYEEKSISVGRTWTRAVSRRCRALLHSALGEMEEAAAEAAMSIAELQPEGLPVELGRSYLVLGQIERRRRQRSAARRALEEALTQFQAAGARIWEAKAREELDRSWSPREGATLTSSEEQMARLAAEGRTNPEIAARMVVSRRTVEATLSRVYKKLGVRSRTELARLRP